MVFGGCKKHTVSSQLVSVPIMFALNYDTLAVHSDFDVTLESIATLNPGINSCVEQVVVYNLYTTAKVFAMINVMDSNYAFISTNMIIVAYADPSSTGSLINGCTSKVALLTIPVD